MYCILGANGFIGRNLVKDLGAKGYGREELDLLDENAVDAFFDKNTFDTVIHCAAIGGSRLQSDDWSVFLKNMKMFENVAKHAHKWKRFVWFSSGAALCARETPYGCAKYVCEKFATTIPNCQVFRIFGCYGDDELPTRFISTCLREPIHIKDRYFDFFWVGHVAEVIKNFTVCDGKIRDLVYEKKFKLSEIARLKGAEILSITEDPSGPYIGEFSNEIYDSIKTTNLFLMNESV